MEQILDELKQIIDCLYELAISIRNPTPMDRLLKAKSIDQSHFQVWDIQHVMNKFPKLRTENPSLLERLGRANTRRREVFVYNKLYLRRPKCESLPLEGETKTVLETDNQDLEEGELVLKPEILPAEYQTSESISNIGAPSTSLFSSNSRATTATSVESDLKLDLGDLNHDTDVSETSSTASEDLAEEITLKIPDPPADALDGTVFECPYCYEDLTVPTMAKWR